MADSSAGPWYFVQFPHPGQEHNPKNTTRQPWNTREHRRKFIQSDGRYVGGNGSQCAASLVFWGEWEAPSYVVRTWRREGLPRFLHKPVWERSTSSAHRQNTDPWVFGDHFLYSNCRQPSQAALRQLTSGSVILFGSNLGGIFAVDTVFVVSDSLKYSVFEPPDTDDAFRVCTIEAIRMSDEYARNRFTLYKGATYKAPTNNMFSFVPCRVADQEGARFSRPQISLASCYLNPLAQGPKNAGKPRALADV